MSKNIDGFKAKLEDLKIQNEQLERQSLYFKSDAFFEKEARLKLNLRKEGEELVIIEKKEKEEKKVIDNIEEKDDSFTNSIKFLFSKIQNFVKF